MSGVNFQVPPKSWASIDSLAVQIREHFGFRDRPDFPIMTVLEKVLGDQLNLLSFEVGTRDEMHDAEGLTAPDGSFIMLREDVYENAWSGKARDRFTASHEFGHWLMHTNIPLPRATSGTEAFRMSEPQANQFAAGLLMPAHLIGQHNTVANVAAMHQVSEDAASNRIAYLKRKGII